MRAEDELISRNDAWAAAIRERDVAAAEGLLADDYALVLVVLEKRVVPRAEWLAMLPEYLVDEWTVEDRVVDQRSDLAAILRLWRRHSSGLEAGALPGSSVETSGRGA